MVKNTHENAILEDLHVVLGNLFHTVMLEGKNNLYPADIVQFIIDAAWAHCSTQHTILDSLPWAHVFGKDMLLHLPNLTDQKNANMNSWSMMQMLKKIQSILTMIMQ